ncbi:MAG: [Fe-Fe] hydrogenase large subunit C-terminal domain-containing protein [Oscillospiraceae bacterium]|jgi:NADH-quinone oxidoreductase subunit G
MGIVVDYDLCTGCGDCVPKCTHNAMRLNGKHLIVDNRFCVDCGICIDYCPSEALDLTENVVGDTHEEKEIDETGVDRVYISPDNPCIMRLEGCNDCHSCVKTCRKRENKVQDENCNVCLGCGQCIHTCEKNVLKPKDSLPKVLDMLKSGRTCIAYTSPATRVALGDPFGDKPGKNNEGKLVNALRKMGFRYVLDVNFAADVTIMEEAAELVERLKGNGKLPMFTSCCPSWVKYAEYFYPDILDHISTCKSPIGMEGALIDAYYCKQMNLNPDDIYTVAITPCTAKKGEIRRKEITGTDDVLTIQELSEWIKENLDFNKLDQNDTFDSFMGTGSGAGAIFGNTGGVMEAAIRTAYHMITGEEIDVSLLKPLHGMGDRKEVTLDISGTTLKAVVINEMSNAIDVLDSVRSGTCEYQFIEIMNCRGGCIGGGGQPLLSEEDEFYVKKNRIESLYAKDQESRYRTSHSNPEVIALYKKYLKTPGSEEAKKILHTVYTDRTDELKRLVALGPCPDGHKPKEDAN